MHSETISRRSFLKYAAVGAAALTLPLDRLLAAETKKPNVIVILSDDHGYAELSCQGLGDVKTPNIDSIAANGIRFTDGYVSAPVCSPSRAGFLTGRYQQRFGHYYNTPPNMDMKDWGLPVGEKTIAQYMKENGYATGAIGKWHLGEIEKYRPWHRGFDEYFGFLGGMHTYLRTGIAWNAIQRNGERVEIKGYLTDVFAREAVSFIDRHKDKPFFLYMAFNAVHAPLEPSPKDEALYPEIKDPTRRKFAKLLHSMDDAVGAILDKVRSAGLEENTIIFFLGDNGGPTQHTTSGNLPLKGYKAQVHEGGIRVPFVAQWKGHIPAGKVSHQPVISLDILPTAVAAAGGKVGANIDGVDLMPQLTGRKSADPHDALFWLYDKQMAARMGDWKLAQYESMEPKLYNLASDIGEKTDLSAKHPDKVKELSAAWDKWNAGNVKPLWQGKGEPAWTKEGF